MKKLIPLLMLSATALGVTASIELRNFNAGEMSPLMNSRSDYAKYDSGAKTLENFLVRAQGPISRRPGTKYIASVKDATDATRLFPFEYSTDNAYVSEAGDGYMRFYRNGGQILNDDLTVYEIATPYDANDIFEIQFAQDAEVMRLVHPEYAPYKLTRTDHNDWTMEEIDFETGPFLTENEQTAATITPSGTGGASGYDYYIYGDDGEVAAGGGLWRAQTFTADANYTATGVKLRLWRYGLPGTVTASLRATSGGEPTGGDLASGTTDGNSLTTAQAGEWREITFGSGQALTSGTTYAIVVRATAGDWANLAEWRYDSSSPSYSGGSYGHSSDSGSSWTMNSSADCMFEVIAQAQDNSSNITLTSSTDIFDANHVGALWRITHLEPSVTVTGNFTQTSGDASSASVTIREGQEYDFSTAGLWTGTIKLQRSYDGGTTWEEVKSAYYRLNGNIQWVGRETEAQASYRLYMDDMERTGHQVRHDEGICSYNLTARAYRNNGVVAITAVADANSASASVIAELSSTDPTWRWSEGAWSTYRGFPRTVEHHEQRCLYGGSTSFPQGLGLGDSRAGQRLRRFQRERGGDRRRCVDVHIAGDEPDPVDAVAGTADDRHNVEHRAARPAG
jgi:hypothetical protein